MAGISQQFCVRWNSHLGSLGAAFPQLLAGQQFVDVTLACDGHQVHCHRLVLAACSSYFESLLSENPCKHPIIILPKEIKLWEIHALVDFMYKGQVNVSQAGLPQLLKCAETLQIRGLCGTDSTLNEVANGKTDHPLSPPNLLANCNPNFTFPPMFPPPNIISNSSYQVGSDQRHQNADFQRVVPPSDNANTKTTNIRANEHFIKSKERASNANGNGLPRKAKSSLKRFSDTETTNTIAPEVNIKCEEIDDSDNGGDESDVDEQSNSKQSEYAMANVVCEYANENSSPIRSSTMSLDDSHPIQDFNNRSMSPTSKRFAGDANCYTNTSEPGRRIRRSESLLRQAADSVSRGQTFQTVSDMFQIPISTIRFFMARKGILPRRKRGRASAISIDSDENAQNRPSNTIDVDAIGVNKQNAE